MPLFSSMEGGKMPEQLDTEYFVVVSAKVWCYGSFIITENRKHVKQMHKTPMYYALHLQI